MGYYQKQTRARVWYCKCGFDESPSEWKTTTLEKDKVRAVCPSCGDSYPVAGPLTEL